MTVGTDVSTERIGSPERPWKRVKTTVSASENEEGEVEKIASA